MVEQSWLENNPASKTNAYDLNVHDLRVLSNKIKMFLSFPGTLSFID